MTKVIYCPLTTLCKLALLNFMPSNTKISISHHILYLQEYHYLQGASRLLYQDTRWDISHINAPLIKAIRWYIYNGDEQIVFVDGNISNSIKIIALYAIKGLTRIQNTTYSDDNAMKMILQYLINMLKMALDGIWSKEYVVNNPNDNTPLTELIKNNYLPTEITNISNMLSEANKLNTTSLDISAQIECIHKLLINRDTNFCNLMKDINTNI